MMSLPSFKKICSVLQNELREMKYWYGDTICLSFAVTAENKLKMLIILPACLRITQFSYLPSNTEYKLWTRAGKWETPNKIHNFTTTPCNSGLVHGP